MPILNDATRRLILNSKTPADLLRADHISAWVAASDAACAELHSAVSLILRGGTGTVDRAPFEAYSVWAAQLCIDARLSDAGILALER